MNNSLGHFLDKTIKYDIPLVIVVSASLAALETLFFTVIFGFGFDYQNPDYGGMGFLLRPCFIGSILLSYIIYLIASRRAGIRSNSVALSLYIIGVTAALTIVIFVAELIGLDVFSIAAAIAFLCFIGTTIAALSQIWLKVLSALDREFGATCLSFSLILCAILFLFVQFLPVPLYALAIAVMIICSSILGLLLNRRYTKIPPTEEAIASKSFKPLPYTDAFIILYGVVFGFAIGSMPKLLTNSELVLIVCFVSLITGVILAPILRKNTNSLIHGKAQRVVFPLLIAGLLPLPFFDGPAQTLPLSIIIICYIAFNTINFDSIVVQMRLWSDDPGYLQSRMRIPMAVGTLVGMVLERAYAMVPSGRPLLVVISCGLILGLAFFIVFVPTEPDVLKNQEEAEAGIQMPSDGDRSARCAQLGSEFNLSPREIDVLELLSKGRGIKHVCEALCISEGTTKTHIYHIYSKLKVSSRDELLNLFDVRRED